MNETAASVSSVKQPVWRSTKFMAAIAGIILLVIGFYSGLLYQKNHLVSMAGTARQTSASGLGNSYGGFGGRGYGHGRRGAVGNITAVSSASITIQPLQSGSAAETFSITSATQILDNGQAASPSDLKVGDTVRVMRSPTDTTLAARIIINPSASNQPSTGGSTNNATTPPPAQSSI